MCILLILTETLNSCLFKFDKWSETVVFTDGQSHAKTKHRYRRDRTSADWRSSGLDFLRYSETGDGTFFCNEAPAQLQNLNIFVLPLEVLPPSYRFPAGCIRLQDLFRIVLHSFDPRGLLQRCVGTAWHTSRWGFCVFWIKATGGHLYGAFIQSALNFVSHSHATMAANHRAKEKHGWDPTPQWMDDPLHMPTEWNEWKIIAVNIIKRPTDVEFGINNG